MPTTPPPTTALGALIGHITGGHLSVEEAAGEARTRSFQPMNINYGLLPDIDAPGQDADGKRLKGKDKGRAKKRAMSVRALADIDRWLSSTQAQAA